MDSPLEREWIRTFALSPRMGPAAERALLWCDRQRACPFRNANLSVALGTPKMRLAGRPSCRTALGSAYRCRGLSAFSLSAGPETGGAWRVRRAIANHVR